MSKENTALAKKIVEQHANIIGIDAVDAKRKPTKTDAFNLEYTKAKVPKHSVELPILGYTFTAYDGTKAECLEQMAKQVAADLDSGDLVLGDDWAATNLT